MVWNTSSSMVYPKTYPSFMRHLKFCILWSFPPPASPSTPSTPSPVSGIAAPPPAPCQRCQLKLCAPFRREVCCETVSKHPMNWCTACLTT